MYVPEHFKKQTLWIDHFYIINKDSNWEGIKDADTQPLWGQPSHSEDEFQ